MCGGKNLFWGALGGLLAWGSYLIFLYLGCSDVIGYLLSSMLITVYAEICARCFRAPATVFLMSSAIPLIPGGSLYRTMVCAVGWTAWVSPNRHPYASAGRRHLCGYHSDLYRDARLLRRRREGPRPAPRITQ